MRRQAIPALAVFAVFAACAPVRQWHNPNLPTSLESGDESACRHEAERGMGPEAATAPGSDRPDDPVQLAERGDNQREFDKQVASCMERKGYSHGH